MGLRSTGPGGLLAHRPFQELSQDGAAEYCQSLSKVFGGLPLSFRLPSAADITGFVGFRFLSPGLRMFQQALWTSEHNWVTGKTWSPVGGKFRSAAGTELHPVMCTAG